LQAVDLQAANSLHRWAAARRPPARNFRELPRARKGLLRPPSRVKPSPHRCRESPKYPGSELPTAITEAPYSQGNGQQGVDVYIKAADFRAVFAGDVAPATANLMAITQRPVTLAALSEKSGVPAWKHIPSWYLIGRQDKAIPPATQTFMAKRAHSHTVEINASHASLVSHPATVTKLVLTAARSVAK
jgi:pimeloyl-ACP methyl ester carboxylesterase